jgi:hypothetical protein
MVYGTFFVALAMFAVVAPAGQKDAATKRLPEPSLPPPQNTAEVRRHTSLVIGPKITRYIYTCVPTSNEVHRVTTTVTMQLRLDGSLDRILAATQTGVDDTNKEAGKVLLQCITGSIRKASPFVGLDPKHYEIWKTHKMVFKPRRSV